MNKQEKKLAKYMTEADQCTSRKKGQKILEKFQKALDKIAQRIYESS